MGLGEPHTLHLVQVRRVPLHLTLKRMDEVVEGEPATGTEQLGHGRERLAVVKIGDRLSADDEVEDAVGEVGVHFLGVALDGTELPSAERPLGPPCPRVEIKEGHVWGLASIGLVPVPPQGFP